MNDESIQDDFFAGRRSAVVPFCVNDSVEITGGQFAGRCGAVVCCVDSGQTYVVELDDGVDASVPRDDLKLLEA